MSGRSAEHTIQGFHFQFLKTIKEILSLTDHENITVEGLFEDIDRQGNISTDLQESVQCKYHSSSDFSPSLIREALFKMFKNHKVKPRAKFTLFIHCSDWKGYDAKDNKDLILYGLGFKDGRLTNPEKIQEKLNQSQSYKLNESETLVITPEEAEAFIKRCSIEISTDISTLEGEVKSTLETALNTDENDVEMYYFSNAVEFILRKSCQSNIEGRQVSKGDFINEINNKQLLFNKWIKQLKGNNYLENKFSKVVRKYSLHTHRISKVMYIEDDTRNDNSEMVSSFLISLVKNTYFFDIQENHQPVTVVLNLNEDVIKKIKIELIKENIFFNDGFEFFEFSKDYFVSNPMFQKDTPRRPRYAKRVSFNVKIISVTNFTNDLCYPEIAYKYIINNAGNSPNIRSRRELNLSDLDNLDDCLNVIKGVIN